MTRIALLVLLLASPAYGQDFGTKLGDMFQKMGEDFGKNIDAYNDGYRRSAREDEARENRRLREDVDDLYYQNQEIQQEVDHLRSRQRGW